MPKGRHIILAIVFFFYGSIDSLYAQDTNVEAKVFMASELLSPKCDLSVYENLIQRAEAFSNNYLVLFGSGLVDGNCIDSLTLKKVKELQRAFQRIIVVPDLDDWQKNKKGGYQKVIEQGQLIDSLFGKEHVFMPPNGCPGPVELKLSNKLVLLLIDPVSWINPWNISNEGELVHQDCGLEDRAEFYMNIDDAIKRNTEKTILLCSYYPLHSAGKHGGKFPLKSHLLPLPGVGSAHVLYRKWFGEMHDLSNYRYKSFRRTMNDIIEKRNLIYLSALEKNMQYSSENYVHFVNVGSMAKSEFVKETDEDVYAIKEKGFVELCYLANKTSKVSMFGKENKPFFSKIIQKEQPEELRKENIRSTESKRVNVPISDNYKAGRVKSFFMGRNYRDVWSAETKFPVIDISQEYGGLYAVKRGGGQQTRSVRMEAKDGRQLVLRSVDKYTEKALPEELKKTFAAAVVQDQISASFPYAAPIVADFADILGVYHTNPKLVYLPTSNGLGIYNEELAGDIYLYEERPDDEWDKIESFGKPDKIQGTPKVLSKLKEDSDNKVDQMAVLRARLFDVWINDWDRHDDQWRWAAFRKGKGWLYRPIPRDRDQAFFVNEGIIPWIASRKWALRKIQGFDKNTKDIPGLVYNARYFDRTFLNEPQLEDWIAMADSMQQKLPDRVIEGILEKMPSTIYELEGEEIKNKLIARRNNLRDFAERFYSFVSKEVDVVGSNKQELFRIEKYNKDSLKLEMFKIGGDISLSELVYQRTFKAFETKEIVLFGLAGNDVFEVLGQEKSKIRIRMVGGDGKDKLIDKEKCKGLGKRHIFYDLKDGNLISSANNSKLKLKRNPSINTYDRKTYKYDVLHPMVNAGYNRDDGFSYGVGVGFRKHAFRKEPFAYYQRFMADISTQTLAYQFKYNGEFTSIFNKVNLLLEADGDFLHYSQNFFGLGNETKIENSELSFYKVRWESINFAASLMRRLSEKITVSGGVFMQFIEVEEREENSFLHNYPDYVNDSTIFDHFHFQGVKLKLVVDTRDDKHLPKHGLYFTNAYKLVDAYDGYYEMHHNLSSELSLYKSFKNLDRVVFAFRFGGAMNIGEYKFFHSHILGGKTNLRGFRNQRFYGKKIAYQNSELRLKLFNFSNYVFKGKAGVLFFNDIGRTWVDHEESDVWHHGYGGGFWLAPFEKVVVTTNWEQSVENDLFTFKFSYFY